MSSNAQVYAGKWTNWDDGTIKITLSVFSGKILLVAIALFITICGMQSWAVCRLLLHQMYSRGESWQTYGPDELDDEDIHFVLRNYTAFGTLLKVPKLALQRLRSPKRPDSPRRPPVFWMVLILLIALINLAGWPVAALFSALVAGTDSHVLITSPDCGIYLVTEFDDETLREAVGFTSIWRNKTAIADQYVQQCYGAALSSNSLCHSFVQQELKWVATTNVSCPFGGDICLGGELPAFEMDTGLLSSHEMFGLNTAPEERVMYRRKTTCSPLVTAGYSELIPGVLPGEEIALYKYGGVGSEDTTFLLSIYSQKTPAGYYLGSVGGGFIPVPELRRKDADLSLFFLAFNNIAYPAPVDDLFFTSHRWENTSITGKGLYYGDKIASVMGCIDQHQICNPNGQNGPRCTALDASGVTHLHEPDRLGFSDLQSNISFIIESLILNTDLARSTGGHGAGSLVAQRTVYDGVNVPLPSNQWHIEVGNWFNIALAGLQHAVVQYATGPPDGQYRPQNRLDTKVFKRLYDNTCSLQKVRQFGSAQGYVTFSFLGLMIIIGVGGLVIVSSLLLEFAVSRPKKGWLGAERRAAWVRQEQFTTWKKSRQEGLELRSTAETMIIHETTTGEKVATPSSENDRIERA